MIYLEAPQNFKPKFEAVCCILEHEGRFLVLKRSQDSPQAGTWGFPAGMVENSEDLSRAIGREISEELGLVLPENKLELIKTVFARFPEFDYPFHVFKVSLYQAPTINLNEEHEEYLWVSPREALEMDLHRGNDEIVKLFYKDAFVN